MNQNITEKDLAFLKHAISLANKGTSLVYPNPRVGAVYVKDDKIIAEGYHEKVGEKHAERNVELKESLENSTLYVSLEPCSHHGKTPPCVDFIIENKIKKVVFAIKDPGEGAGGAQALKEAGIAVEGPFEINEAHRILEPFIKNMLHKQTYISAKWAMSLDGRIATKTKKSKWISGEESRKDVHLFRSVVDGIMVGAGTLVSDNPKLNIRYGIKGCAPRPIVWDPAGKTIGQNWYSENIDRKPIILVKKHIDAPEGCKVILFENLKDIPTLLFEEGIHHVLLEGGAQLLGFAKDVGIIDAVICYIAPKLIGGLHALSPMGGKGVDEMSEAIQLTHQDFSCVGQDIKLQGLLKRYHPSLIV